MHTNSSLKPEAVALIPLLGTRVENENFPRRSTQEHSLGRRPRALTSAQRAGAEEDGALQLSVDGVVEFVDGVEVVVAAESPYTLDPVATQQQHVGALKPEHLYRSPHMRGGAPPADC